MSISPTLLTFATPQVQAQNSQLNQPFFRQSPRLIRSATTFQNPAVLAHYQFTIEIPSEAKVPLKSIQVVQKPNLQQVIFFAEETYAFFGNSLSGGEKIPLESVNINPASPNEVTVIFATPIEPGSTITIALRSRNPLYGGIYQFGITVFPEGSQQGLYLGSGRIHLSQPGGVGG